MRWLVGACCCRPLPPLPSLPVVIPLVVPVVGFLGVPLLVVVVPSLLSPRCPRRPVVAVLVVLSSRHHFVPTQLLPVSTPQAVARRRGWGTVPVVVVVAVVVPVPSLSHLPALLLVPLPTAPPFPPREQLLAVRVGGAVVVVVPPRRRPLSLVVFPSPSSSSPLVVIPPRRRPLSLIVPVPLLWWSLLPLAPAVHPASSCSQGWVWVLGRRCRHWPPCS